MGKIWNFIWHSNSPLSWIVNILLAFILIRFIIYPGAGLILGTPLPIVAVISESMEHRGGSDWIYNRATCSQNNYCLQEEWYLEKGIRQTDFKEFPFSRGFNKGDIMLIRGKASEKLEIGDVIVFNARTAYPIIHRIVEIHDDDGLYFETKGDNNHDQKVDRQVDETKIMPESVLGVAYARIPYVGYVKIWATNIFQWVFGR